MNWRDRLGIGLFKAAGWTFSVVGLSEETMNWPKPREQLTQTLGGPVDLHVWDIWTKAGDELKIIDLPGPPVYRVTGRTTPDGFIEALYLDPEAEVGEAIELVSADSCV